jgi:outer membrane immunogenic protein
MKKMLIAAAMLPLAGLCALPAAAQTAGDARPFTAYGNLGYSHTDRGISDLGGITGRLGLRYGRVVGIEAEGTFGVTDDHSVRYGPATTTKLDRSVAAYAVAFAPITQRIELLGRVGLGNTVVKTEGFARPVETRRDSINYGVGAQFFLTDNDGLRLDLTRESLRHGPGRADTYGLSYVRKF